MRSALARARRLDEEMMRSREQNPASAVRGVAKVAMGCLVAVWVGYPLIIGALAKYKRKSAARRREMARSTGTPTVSVIIATRDDVGVVRQRIDDCLKGAPETTKLEVVVAIDSRDPDAWDADLAGSPEVKVVRGDDPGGKSATLNAAVREARGELLVFTDSRQRFEPHAIARLVAAFADERIGAASGRLELSPGASRSLVGRYWSVERWLRRSEAAVHSCIGATGAIWAMRRALWSPLPPHLILDDVYGPMRVVLNGYRVGFVDEARAVDLREPDRGQEYRRKVRTLTGVLQLCCWLPSLLVPVRNPVWPQFVCHKLLRLLTPYWVIAVGARIGSIVLGWTMSRPAVRVVPLAAVGLVGVTGKGKVFRLAREGVKSALMLQAAAVVAGMNGARRRWDVWRPS
jgi:cellulose synthase/poly-beta-1,6-N-acetylglucosamine synthase-like glycosyltransferase